MSDKYQTALRLQLLALGYSIIPNINKECRTTGWNTPEFAARENTAARIESWPRRFPEAPATGLRLENGVGAIDIDVDHPIVDALMAQVAIIAPDVAARAPTRYGGGTHKIALFVQIEGELFRRVYSRKYIFEGKEHCVEIFSGRPTKDGKCSRQFGIAGPHSEGVRYQFAEGVPALADVAPKDLPRLTREQASAIVDAFEALADAAGWERMPLGPDTGSATAVYDIDDDTRFDTDRAGRGLTYAELDDAIDSYGTLRCSSSFMKGRIGTNTARCWVFHSPKHDCAAVYVYGDEQTHYPKSKAPMTPEQLAEAMKAIPAPVVRTQGACAPERPGEKATLREQAAWLLATHAYCAANDTVVELDEPSDGCQMKVVAFQRLFRSWYEETEGPKGGKNRDYATGWWELAEARINVRGVRMRPDMPYPVYAEAGAIYKNTYLRPRHEGSGDIAPWLAFMEHLLPARDEREWFCNWLAHKHLHPGVPGVAVVMVAVDERGPVYGAGRGILRDVIARLLGPKYVKPIDFDVFTGSSPQGIYTDWGAYATVVTVNEAKDTADSGHWANRRAVYERLKELVDPRAIERTFLPKGKQAFTAHAFASYLVFSNNRDALQIPVDDRRVTALANGGRMSGEMAAGLQAWMADAGNIAELARWLEARDLAGFDVYAPPHTDTKATMQELARSELDEAFEAVRATIGPRGLFTGEMLLNAVVHELNDASEPMQRGIKRTIRAAARKIAIAARMPPASGRGWILAWRGHDTAYVTDTTGAQQAVEHTGRRLAEQHGSRFGLPSRTG